MNTKEFLIAATLVAGLVLGCGSGPAPAPAAAPAAAQAEAQYKPASSSGISLDEAIRLAAARMDERLPAGTEVALISVSSPSETFSRYVLDGLEAALVDSGKLVVVDRANLDKVRAEQGFQLSGEVSDDSAKSIGQMVGAGAIVTGSLLNIGSLYRLTLKAIDVERAVVAVSLPADIAGDERVRALLAQAEAPRKAVSPPAAQAAPAQAAASAATPATGPAPGALYSGDAMQGEMGLLDALDWISLNAQSGGNYTIALGKDAAITPTELGYGGKTLAITLKSAGGKRTVGFEGKSPAYSLFTVGAGVTLTLEDGVTLRGAENEADKSVVRVSGGRFVMAGGTISGNKTSGSGGGVSVLSGTFTMTGGTIGGNTATRYGGSGGGVYVKTGAFTMSGGTINGNAAGSSDSGGGVHMDGGTFTMSDGAISGNTARYGGGVCMNGGTFTMNDGTISGNTAGYYGGGVAMGSGTTFAMSGGAIGGNTADDRGGGGVYMESGKFTMSGGAIGGNTARDGGGVYMGSGAFTKSAGAVIYGSNAPDQANSARDDSRGHAVYVGGKKRNTTARAATVMDSAKDGPAGGWE